MTLRARLSLGLAAVALVLVLPQLLAVRALQTVDRSMQELRAHDFATSLNVGRLRAGAEELERLDLATIAVPDSAEPRQALAATLDSLGRAAEDLRRVGLTEEADAAAAELAVIRRTTGRQREVGSSRVDLQACKLEYSIVSPK